MKYRNARQRKNLRGKIASQLGACAAKHRYPDQMSAERALIETRQRPYFTEAPGQKLRVYRCVGCHGWHLGNAVIRGRERRSA